jgi:ribonuclease P protein component
MAATLSRCERLSGTTAVAELFTRGKSFVQGCIRCKYLFRDDDAPSRIVVSVPKRSFKRAVKRNLLKRRLRESYRLQKDLLGSEYDILFVYNSREVLPFDVIFADMAEVLKMVAANVNP